MMIDEESGTYFYSFYLKEWKQLETFTEAPKHIVLKNNTKKGISTDDYCKLFPNNYLYNFSDVIAIRVKYCDKLGSDEFYFYTDVYHRVHQTTKEEFKEIIYYDYDGEITND